MMKKFTLAAMFLSMSLFASAQNMSVNISSINGTNIEKYDGQVVNVKMNRYMFTGWNTVSFPFDLSTNQVNEFFGNDCRLEKLTNVTAEGTNMYLNFQNAKAEGIKANTPYILYFTGEPQDIRITTESALQAGESKMSFPVNGFTVSFVGTDKIMNSTDIYGIFAADNKESKFVKIEGTTGCYATRCYMTIDSNQDVTFIPVHNEMTTGITKVAAEKASDKVYNINGTQKKAVSKGINVMKGKKIVVK